MSSSSCCCCCCCLSERGGGGGVTSEGCRGAVVAAAVEGEDERPLDADGVARVPEPERRVRLVVAHLRNNTPTAARKVEKGFSGKKDEVRYIVEDITDDHEMMMI